MGACGDVDTRNRNHYAPVADAATLTVLVGRLVEEHKDFILHQRIRMAKDELNKAARNLGDVILEERIPLDLLTKARTYLGAAAAQMNAQSECCDSYIIWTKFMNTICTEIVNKCVHEPVHDIESQNDDFPDHESSEQVDFEVESEDQFDEFLGKGMNTYTPMPTHVVEQSKVKQENVVSPFNVTVRTTSAGGGADPPNAGPLCFDRKLAEAPSSHTLLTTRNMSPPPTRLPISSGEQFKEKQAAMSSLTWQELARVAATAQIPLHAANYIGECELHSLSEDNFIKHVHTSECGLGASVSPNLAVDGAKPPGRDCPMRCTSVSSFACKDPQ
jgi:hypothetical protein